jgi:hypothetical protein
MGMLASITPSDISDTLSFLLENTPVSGPCEWVKECVLELFINNQSFTLLNEETLSVKLLANLNDLLNAKDFSKMYNHYNLA